ncbi:putative colanic acid biosynthesis acetyltransferase WcaF [Caulobacter ginsengisoli]|uniref:Colanic acid biosynthesis acetyltransferase WcaF n=1 Tax=Caulobacter ginsengisoli TaxID=400775 RepID=A0ABU0IM90_9CAUL|nr:colanic acid biosynthesis acetyltransferase WcaF [Caulobacter ginsengisoli]MDQ0463128.1 putative colanic acid biosynthesis acetyltransferase WcaF [Caulobacter ginsengisoli]
MSELDIAANRAARKWTTGELLGRALWETGGQLLFALTPRPFWGWRRQLLRLFGARIAKGVHLHPRVRITVPWNLDIAEYAAVGEDVRLYNLGLVSIGAAATVSQGAHLCAGTHDYRKADLPLVKATIRIEGGAWVCADAFIGPGVTVGDHAIVGARAVAVRDVAPYAIMAGNPARQIGLREMRGGA